MEILNLKIFRYNRTSFQNQISQQIGLNSELLLFLNLSKWLRHAYCYNQTKCRCVVIYNRPTVQIDKFDHCLPLRFFCFCNALKACFSNAWAALWLITTCWPMFSVSCSFSSLWHIAMGATSSEGHIVQHIYVWVPGGARKVYWPSSHNADTIGEYPCGDDLCRKNP